MPEVPYNYLMPRVAGLMGDGKKVTVASPARIEYDAAGRCEAPIPITMEGRPYRADAKGVPLGRSKILVLATEARCRKCSACLAARRREWTRRAVVECERSHRTWFGTLTLRPGEHALAKFRAMAHYRTRDPTFAQITDMIGKDVTRMVKRVREATKARMKYLLVVEAHASGLPHFHMLVHEQSGTKITKRMLESQWPLGFTKWKLVEETARGAGYTCKYLAKEAASRVRASRFYGSLSREKTTEGHSPSREKEAA